jgi:hypothetical protein
MSLFVFLEYETVVSVCSKSIICYLAYLIAHNVNLLHVHMYCCKRNPTTDIALQSENMFLKFS